MNPARGEIVGQTAFFNFGIATGLREEKQCIQTVKLSINIDLVSHPVPSEGLGNYTFVSFS